MLTKTIFLCQKTKKRLVSLSREKAKKRAAEAKGFLTLQDLTEMDLPINYASCRALETMADKFPYFDVRNLTESDLYGREGVSVNAAKKALKEIKKLLSKDEVE